MSSATTKRAKAPAAKPATTSVKVDDVVTAVTGSIFGNGKSTKEKLPAGATSTTTPAGIRRFDPDVVLDENVPSPDDTVEIALRDLVRHPVNRHPDAADIAARAESLKEKGQLEDIVVRPVAGGKYEVLSGETRWLAAAKLKWSTIKAKVRPCDDAQALELLAEYNTQRANLNPIEKAELIAAMCLPIKEGGKLGLTRAQAAKRVGAKDHSTASNLVRLLELPDSWRYYVKTEEVPWTWAIRLVPYAKSPRLMKAIEEAYLADKKAGGWDFEENWSTRDKFEDTAECVCRDNSRTLEARWYGADFFADGLGMKYQGQYPCLIELDEDLERRLEIIEVTVGENTGRIACNVELFDKLQREAIIRQVDAQRAKEEARPAKKGAAAKGAAPDISEFIREAEAQADKKQRKDQIERGIDAWKQTVMRKFVAEQLTMKAWVADKAILYWLTYHHPMTDWQGIVSRALSTKSTRPGLTDTQRKLDAIADGNHGMLARVAIARMLMIGGDQHQPVPVETPVLAAWLDDVGLSLAMCWSQLQQTKDELFAEYFEIYRKDELVDVGREYELHLDAKLSKGQMVKLLTTRSRPLLLPKCLQEKPAKKSKG